MKRVMAALLLLAGAAQAGPWPTDNITTTHVDAATDDPSQARAEIYTTMLRVKDVIGARNSASGVAPLDASALVPLANIPATLTGKSADTLDGINSTSFARVDAASNFTTAPTISGNTVWHAGNDGAGSGLDADLLDGVSSAGFAASGANANITSMSGLTGTVSSAKACASGYTRVSPNYCKVSVVGAFTDLTRDSCTLVMGPSPDTRAIELLLYPIARSANAGGANRYSLIEVFGGGGCVDKKGFITANAYEFTAITNGTPIMAITAPISAKTDQIGGGVYLRLNDDLGNQGGGSYYITGYYD